MTASRRRFSQECKDELCLEVISTSRTIKDVALAYGVGPETLRNWLVKYRLRYTRAMASGRAAAEARTLDLGDL